MFGQKSPIWTAFATTLCLVVVLVNFPKTRQAICRHVWQDPTCTAPKLCLKCGATLGEPLAHDWLVATCTNPATCSRCGVTSGEPLGHEVSGWEVTIDPTCSTPGEESIVCTGCGEVVETREVPILEHSFGEWETVQEPTCDVCGSKERTCFRCGFVDKEPIARLAHTFSNDELVIVSGSTVGRVCDVCGQIAERCMQPASEVYTYSEIVGQAEARKGEVFKISGRVTGVSEGTPLIKVTKSNPKGGKVDTVLVYVKWGDDDTFHTGEVARVEIDGSLYYGEGWNFRGDRIRSRRIFAATCTLVGLDEDGHPRFTCTNWTCK